MHRCHHRAQALEFFFMPVYFALLRFEFFFEFFEFADEIFGVAFDDKTLRIFHRLFEFLEQVGCCSKATATLLPLYQYAASSSIPKFINLDMEEYKDLDLTLAVFTGILDRPEFKDLAAGIVLQAYLPDALGAMMKLQEWAAARVADGGAAVKVRVVKGANLPMELVDAAIHGWPAATWAPAPTSWPCRSCTTPPTRWRPRTASWRTGRPARSSPCRA